MSSSNIRLVRWLLPSAASAEPRGSTRTTESLSRLHPWQLAYLKEEEQLWNWNHEFWLEMNSKFNAQMNAYVAEVRKATTVPAKTALSSDPTMTPSDSTLLDPEVMAVFYRTYLEENKPIFQNYHRQWWRRNWAILGSSFKAFISRFFIKGV